MHQQRLGRQLARRLHGTAVVVEVLIVLGTAAKAVAALAGRRVLAAARVAVARHKRTNGISRCRCRCCWGRQRGRGRCCRRSHRIVCQLHVALMLGQRKRVAIAQTTASRTEQSVRGGLAI